MRKIEKEMGIKWKDPIILSTKCYVRVNLWLVSSTKKWYFSSKITHFMSK